MTITAIQLTDTFDTWRGATNNLISATNAQLDAAVLATLQTSAKNSLVAAINEVYNKTPSSVLLGTSSLTSPAFAVLGDTNTGIGQLGGADTISLIAGGAEVLRAAGVANSVNRIDFSGAATGSTPIINFTGSDANVGGVISTKGTGWLGLHPGGSPALAVVPVTNAANYIKASGATTGGAPYISFEGTDASVGGTIYTKGNGWFSLAPGGAPTASFSPVTNSVNYIRFQGGISGTSPHLSFEGSDANVSGAFYAKGAGNHIFYTNSGSAQVVINNTTGANRYLTLTGSNGGNPTISTSAGALDLRAADGNAVYIGTGLTAAAPTQMVIAESAHATSRRSFFNIGLNWGFGQDCDANGTRDFGLWLNSASTWIWRVATTGVTSFFKAVRGGIVALTDGATITPDFNAGNYFSVTLAGNRTLTNPSNLAAGQGGSITIRQDATGNRTLAYGNYWKFPGGTIPTLSTTANAVDKLVYEVVSATEIHATLVKDFK